MRHTFRRTLCGSARLLGLGGLLAGCDLDVLRPGLIAASEFDPSTDAATVSLSAQSLLYTAVGSTALWQAAFTNELLVLAGRQEGIDISRRVATSLTSDVALAWSASQISLATNDFAVSIAAKSAGAASSIDLARAAMNGGFSLVLMAETYCQGAIAVGPPLTPSQVDDSAIVRFTKAVAVGTVAAAAGVVEGTKVVNASNVGLARAYLQQKKYASAAATAALVPAAFVYNAITVDDASNRQLGNQVFIGGGYGMSPAGFVPTVYAALQDPRVRFTPAPAGFQNPLQSKFSAYGTPIRIASGLEASYIGAEANLQTGNSGPALTLIASRRTANGQPAFTGTDAATILAELMDQRAREFWLEGKHLGDWQRNPAATPYVPAAGTLYYRPGQGNFGTATCLPVPALEVNANPNFPKS